MWGGAKLADVLELVGVPKLTSVTRSGGKHVEFVSVDKCKVRVQVILGHCFLLTKKRRKLGVCALF